MRLLFCENNYNIVCYALPFFCDPRPIEIIVVFKSRLSRPTIITDNDYNTRKNFIAGYNYYYVLCNRTGGTALYIFCQSSDDKTQP